MVVSFNNRLSSYPGKSETNSVSELVSSDHCPSCIQGLGESIREFKAKTRLLGVTLCQRFKLEDAV